MTQLPRKHPLVPLLLLLSGGSVTAHDHTRPAAGDRLAQAGLSRPVTVASGVVERPGTLRLRLQDAETREPRHGLVRITPLERAGGPLALDGLFERPGGWYSAPQACELRLPRGKFQVEAVHGVDTTIARAVVDFTDALRHELALPLHRFYRPEGRRLRSTNTHLHLILDAHEKMGVPLGHRRDADNYLQVVGGSDGLDLVYVSYLTRPDTPYVSNEYTDADLAGFSRGPTRFANGVEHRHGGTRVQTDGTPSVAGPDVAMSYGHVLLLDLARRTMPASLGPGLSEDRGATDGVPLRTGMIDARQQGAGVIWCHGTQGLEDIPNWVAGLIHAQNIYDGGNEGVFDNVYYPYLNAGFRVPFSTGTDWGVTDFSRVYVDSPAAFSSKIFLQKLAEGRTFITNEPLLEFTVGDSAPGDTVRLGEPGRLQVRGRAVGRSDFVRVQLVVNGRIVREAASRPVAGHFEAEIDAAVDVRESGWLALRISPTLRYDIRSRYSGPGTNILGKAIFAHTSPVYVAVAGRPVFDAASVGQLHAQVRAARQTVLTRGAFASAAERDGILRIYDEAAAALRARSPASEER